MRWPAFVIFAYIALALELGLADLFVLRSLGGIRPSFVAVLATFVALLAPRVSALWGAWILGLLLDLVTTLSHGDDRAGPLIGANALGYSFGCFLLLQIRAMLIRRHAITLGAMTVAFLVAANLVAVAIYVVHGLYPGDAVGWAGGSGASELVRRLGIALYSGLLAYLLAAVGLFRMTPLWAFRGSTRSSSAHAGSRSPERR